MQQRPSKRATKRERTKREVATSHLREVTIDDVIGALLDLFGQLHVDAAHVASRVKYLDHAIIPSHRLYPHAAAIGELLTAWHRNPDYLDDLGDPLPIKMRGARRSFANLAKSAVPDIHPSALLNELERVGAVSVDKSRFIRVRMRSLPVYEDKRLAIQHTLTSLYNFVKTLRHNLDSDPSNSDQLFHRIAWNGAFDAKLVPNLKIKVKRQGQNLLEAFDNWMLRKAKERSRLSGSRSKQVQVSIGIYLAVGEGLAAKK